jgi:alkylation response protein AidB-like acyl-CoA dehydrogenase
MGLLGVPFPEAYGGFGGTAVDVMVVMQELGRGLVVEPYLATVVLGGGLVDLAGAAAQKQDILPRVARGKWLLALAHGEPQSRYDLHDVATTARREGPGYVLNGRKAVTLHGATADTLIVAARTAGGQRDLEGITLFLVDAKMRGVRATGYRTIDGLRAADIALDGVDVGAEAVLGPVDGGLPLLERAVDRGAAALCAEAVGVIEALNAATLEYLKTRQQFGQPIGRFQALQHRAVDMLIHAEQSKSMACLAAAKAQSDDAAERRRAVSAAKSLVGRAGRAIAKEAIQLHGGMGVTNELPAAHLAKRLTMIDFWLGDADFHTARFAAG